MTTAARIRTLLLTLFAMLTLLAAPAFADDDDRPQGAEDNAAVAEANDAGESIIDLAFSVRETASDVIDETNTAVAYAQCEACRAVAIAFQIVIVQGSPGTVTPQNVAVAVNENCPDCSTLALAYQFVVGRGEPLEFTERGRSRLAKIRRNLEKLEKDFDELTDEEIRARTDGYAEQIRDILANDLVPVDARKDDDDDRPRIDREDSENERGSPATTSTTPAPAEPVPPPEPAQTTTAPPPPAETAPPDIAPTETAPPQQPPTTTPAP